MRWVWTRADCFGLALLLRPIRGKILRSRDHLCTLSKSNDFCPKFLVSTFELS